MDYPKAVLLFVTLAFQLVTLSIAMAGYTVSGVDLEDRDNAIKAFLIIGYILLLGAFILQVLQAFGSDLKENKILKIFLIIDLLCAAACVVIGIAIYGDTVDYNNGSNSAHYAFSMTTYTSSAACAIIAGVFIILDMCGCAK